MDTYLLVLAAVDGLEKVPGRTALQKACYFANEKFGGGIPYFAHYFGPYSKAVAKARSDLVGSNFLREEIEAGRLASPNRTDRGVETEWQRHNYLLTQEGTDLLERLRDKLPDEFHSIHSYVDAVGSATGLDLARMAPAAKVHFVVTHEGASTTDEVVDRALAHDWRLSRDDVASALDTLDGLELGLSLS